ncbi:MAG TPA: NAD(P)-binding domain-containing protein [Burkholderiaceae bacterium]|nr:NAD(P)-binding domain-containing protein [Burkholderiaceae bacterium]HRH86496.1 NAD(P)-binding domain-containing protein [Rubrivivax sp.]
MNSTAIDRPQLEQAVQAADLRVLLMVLVHMTGDLAWLEAPFLPRRDVNLIPDPGAGLPPEAQERIRAAALDVLARGGEPAIHDPGDELMQRMMSVCLGENVAPQYARLTREEMALVRRRLHWPDVGERPAGRDDHVLIVGAGICGIALGASLAELGIPFTIVEKTTEIGGTWNVNRYPGCGVDTPNHAYSFSFGPRYPWPRYFSRREDILTYLLEVVESLDLRRHVRFSTRLTSARWDDAAKRWEARLQGPDGESVVHTRFLVSAIGQLSDPSMPRIEGAADFTGVRFHSSKWPEGLPVDGKRVAVIGTGATVMQLLPEIADRVKSVAVYQRSPQWSRPIPGYSDFIGQDAQWLLVHAPYYAAWFRFNMFWRYGDGLLKTLKKDPDWPHPERAVNAVNDRHRREMTDFILSELADRPDLVPKCVPDYPPYGKRILLDNGWYRTLKKPTVELVTEPIQRIVSNGIETADGMRREADILVFATGFKLSEMAARLGITGVGGRTLAQAWANDDPSAYLGLSVPGFPNFFCMVGPGSSLGHGGSITFQAECQARYITSCIAQMAARGVDAIDVRPEVLDDFMQRFDAEHETLIWSHPGMSTYYRNPRGRVYTVLPWRLVDYWLMTHDADLDDYRTSRVAKAVER